MASLRALTGDDEIDMVLRYLKGCHDGKRAARLTAENVDALLSLLDHLFSATAAIPTVQLALAEMLGSAETDKLIKLLVKLDPNREFGRLAKAVA
jgi:hypothetical protein